MKIKLTFFVLCWFFLPFTARTQVNEYEGKIKSLIISEIRGGFTRPYVELTNVGNTAIDLSEFKVAKTSNLDFENRTDRSTRLPDTLLQPGASFLIAHIYDFYDNYGPAESGTWVDLKDKIDFPVYHAEKPSWREGFDSISVYPTLLGIASDGFYLAHHLENDSSIIDAVYLPNSPVTQRDIAGITGAWNNYVLVRKTSVKEGNPNWNSSRGNSLEDSEWLPIPYRITTYGWDKRIFTTVKHYGNSDLNDEFVSSEVVTIDWENNKMTFPWGIRAAYVMNEFDLGGGIAWHYHRIADSSSNIVVTGDILTLYAVGEDLKNIDFTIEQGDAPEDLARVFPKNKKVNGNWPQQYYVTIDQPEIDTVGNIGFATRVDSLYKYLDKAPLASWEIIWADGNTRVDVKLGDILRVTSQDGTTKDYYLSVETVPAYSNNARLSAITWPDAPGFLRESIEWNGDTIPNFQNNNFSYRVVVPYGTNNVPALTAVPEDVNAVITVERATNLNGTIADRRTTFTVTAEDGATNHQYTVLFEIEKPDHLIQPLVADPIFTQFSHFSGRTIYLQISNPGNQTIDLSNYMIARQPNATSLQSVIEFSLDNFNNRYNNYVPGYVFQSQEEWDIKPAIIEKDYEVDPFLAPGETFAIGYISQWYDDIPQYQYDAMNVMMGDNLTDVEILSQYIDCQLLIGGQTLARYGTNNTIVLLKIINDSIQAGTKALGDPADFKLVDLFGDYSNIHWQPIGEPLPGQRRIERKSGFWKGATQPGVHGSWGVNADESEWIVTGRDYYEQMGYTVAQANIMIGNGIGFHSFDPITDHISTISSYVYKVSDGFASPQTIEGVSSGISVDAFLANIIKAHEDQSLEIAGKSGSDVLADDDILKVTSATQINITDYNISFSALDNNAVLAAKDGSGYIITHEGSEGTITGFQIGTTIRELLDNIDKPASAILNIIDESDNLVPLQIRNFAGEYSNMLADHSISFEVIAEDGVTIIIYALIPDSDDDDAYVYSDVYDVDQQFRLVSSIPQGTNVQTLFKYLKPNYGSTIKLVDKIGNERVLGDVAQDDRVIVTSADSSVTRIYYLTFIDQSTASMAYVISDAYIVDQDGLTISGIPADTPLATFLEQITAAPGATVTILDAQGNVVTSGNLEEGYTLIVTSGDNLTVLEYEILTTPSSVRMPVTHKLNIYPNPATDYVFIEGIRENSKIVIVNISGRVEKIIDSRNINSATISVSDLPIGLYFIYMQNANHRSAPVKLIKK